MNHPPGARARLAARQAELLAALWDPAQAAMAGAWPAAGLQAYRGNLLALAERALGAAYPVLRQCLGEADWAALARDHGQACPPRRGDLACWGEGLADWLQALPPGHELPPWLPELARAEWRLHRLAALPDAEPDTASLQRLLSESPDALVLRLAPGTEVWHSEAPVVSLLHAHGAGTEQAQEAPDARALQALGPRLREGVGEIALCWRAGWRPRIQALTAAEAAWFRALLSQPHLGAALDAIEGLSPPLDLGAWLQQALHQQWLLAVQDAGTC